jgi:outer membrane protein TolC
MFRALLIVFLLSIGTTRIAPAADPADLNDSPTVLTLDQAIEIALSNSYAIRNVALSVREADSQVQGAFGQIMPSVSLASSYQRNVKSANPFAGSSAGNFFSGLGSIGWLAYNERARTDDDPSTVPISLDEFNRRQDQGLDEAGIVLDGSDNPFAVDNQFFNGLTVSQTLYDGRALVAIEAARSLKASTEAALERQLQLVVHQVRQAYLQALLAQENAVVVAASIERTTATLVETQKRVAQGVASKFQRLSAEVELSNLETQLIQVRNNAELAANNLKLTIGLPVDNPILLDGSLESTYSAIGFYQAASLQDAVGTALAQRPDLQQAEIAVELQRFQREAETSSYFPVVSAFANVNYTGRVPDNRAGYRTDPDDPFRFTPTESGFFSSQYWNPDVNVGVRLSWTVFDGFQRKARIQQQQIGVERRILELEQLYESVRGEVDAALRSVRAAEQRIASQSQNVERAEVNYQFAGSRLAEGVSSPLEERQASELLDQSRVAYLQAIHDYLIALSNYYTAIGAPLRMSARSPRLTGN